MELDVLTWNLFHGRSIPPSRGELLEQFGDALASWQWDVALLQEVPPWWPGPLAERLRADVRCVLTSRNSVGSLRRAVGRRRPELLKANAGGCNAILVRGPGVLEHLTDRLRLLPERRMLQAVRLEGGVWVANVHLGGSLRECRQAAATARRWADSAPVVLGGDFNVHFLALDGFVAAGSHEPDHIFARGLTVARPPRVLSAGPLSDHRPVLARVAAG
jgi:endonuclease/exonuclease/phosphatase family metal-dependent hydrolase